MNTKTVHIRIDADVKDRADEVLDSLGLTMSGAVNIFLRRVILENGIPFPLKNDGSKSED